MVGICLGFGFGLRVLLSGLFCYWCLYGFCFGWVDMFVFVVGFGCLLWVGLGVCLVWWLGCLCLFCLGFGLWLCCVSLFCVWVCDFVLSFSLGFGFIGLCLVCLGFVWGWF